MAMREESVEYKELVKMRERQSRGLEKRRTLSRLRGPVQVYLSQKGYTNDVSARLDNTDIESDTVPYGLDIDAKDWPDAKRLIAALKNKDYSGLWSDNTSSEDEAEHESVNHVTRERKSRPGSFRASLNRKAAFESLSSAKFLRPREKAATTNISTDELDDLDLFVSRRLRYKNVSSNDEHSKPPQASAGTELGWTAAQVNCSALSTHDIPQTKAWHEAPCFRGKESIVNTKAGHCTNDGREKLIGLSQGGLQNARIIVPDIATFQSYGLTVMTPRDPAVDTSGCSKAEFDYDRNSVVRKPATSNSSRCKERQELEIISGWNTKEVPSDKSLTPSHIFSQKTPAEEGPNEYGSSPEPISNVTPARIPKSVPVKASRDLHVDLLCSLEDRGVQPSFPPVIDGKKFAFHPRESGCPRSPSTSLDIPSTQGQQGSKDPSAPPNSVVIPPHRIPPVPAVTTAHCVMAARNSKTNRVSVSPLALTAHIVNVPTCQTHKRTQQPTGNDMNQGRSGEPGDKPQAVRRKENTGTQSRRDEGLGERGGQKHHRQGRRRHRAPASMAFPGAVNAGVNGPISTQHSIQQTKRSSVSLKPTLAANFTRRRPQSDASLTRKKAVAGPDVRGGCHMTKKIKNGGDRQQQTTVRVQ